MIGFALAALPQKLLAEVVGVVLEIVLVAGIAVHFTAAHYEAKEAAAMAAAAQATASAAIAAQTETARRVAAQEGITHDAQVQAAVATADAASAAHARDALRVQLDAYVSASRGPRDPGSAALSAPTGDPIGVLADVLGRADDRAGRLAVIADQSRVAGRACERAYDALTPSQ